jgi:hypothetical protein
MCLKKIWNKTIFPDLIKRKKEKKEQQRNNNQEIENIREQLQHEARKEALTQSKEIIKQKMVEEEIKNITEGKQNKFTKILKNIGDDLAGSGFKLPDNERMRDVWGANKTNPGSNTATQTSQSTLPSQEKIASMMGGLKTQNNNELKSQNNNRFESDRITQLINRHNTQQKHGKK